MNASRAKRSRFQWRAFVALSMFGILIALGLSGIALYIAPSGQVARTLNWHWLGLGKNQWEALHIVFSAFSLVVGYFHVQYNWRSIVGYFRRKVNQARQWRLEGLIAMAVFLLLGFTAIAGLPPASQLVKWSESIGRSWEARPPQEPLASGSTTNQIQGRYGRYTVAELAEAVGISPQEALQRLAAYDVHASPTDRLWDLSAQEPFTPGELAAIIMGQEPGTHQAEIDEDH